MARQTYVRPTMSMPDIGGDSGRAGLSVVAQPVQETRGARPQDGSNELAQALANFHSPLSRFFDRQEQQDIKDAHIAGDAEAGKRFADDPVAALQSPSAAPDWLPPAYSKDFQEGYRQSIGGAFGAKSRVDMLAQYDAHKNEEGFDPEAFLRDFTAKDFAGINDPLLLSKATPHIEQGASQVRTDWAQTQAKRLRETNEGNLQIQLDAAIRPDVEPTQMARVFREEILPAALKSGQFTRTELSERFVNQLQIVSQKGGGMPEVFDAADVPDASGMSPSRSSPALAEKVTQMRLAAQAKRDASINSDNLLENVHRFNALHDAVTAGDWDAITDDKLYPLVGKGNVFHSVTDMQAFRTLRDKEHFGQEKLKLGIRSYQDGGAWMMDPKDAKAAYDQITAPFEKSLLDNLNNPQGGQAVNDAITSILGVAQRGNLGHVNDNLKRRIDAFAVAVPDIKGQPPTDFKQMANVYSAIKSQNPTLLQKYFDGDARDLFESYVNDTTKGVNPQAAFASAYTAISPEEKKRVENIYKANPQFEQNIAGKVSGLTTSWNMFRAKWMGTFPTNESAMKADAMLQVRQELLKHPNMGADEALGRVTERIKGSYVYESETNTVVKVPFGQANDKTKEAITDWVKGQQASWGKDSGLALGVDRDGMLTYQTVNPARMGKVPLNSVVQDYAVKTELQPADIANLNTLRTKMKDGTLTADDIAVTRGTTDKLKTMGKLTQEDEAAIRQFSRPKASLLSQSLSGFQPVAPKNADPKNDYAGTSSVDLLDPKAKPVLDNKGEVARMFLQQGNHAGALTAMGEGVALTAYSDPANGAGLNIGMGYNKNGNANTWQGDFKAAGIPTEQWDAVWGGKASITREQAMRLYQVSSARYATEAKKAYGEGWDSLPDNQKAVLMDLQWQVRGGLSGFPKAIAAFKAGDLDEASKQILVNYTDRSGVRKADVGRNSLRSNMLAGPGRFSTLLNYLGKPTTNIVQATAGKDS